MYMYIYIFMCIHVTQRKARAIELVLLKHELQAELSKEEFGKLVEVHLK